MAIHITCDICKKEPQDNDFAFEATKMEMKTFFEGKSMNPNTKMKKDLIQICKECYYKHIDKLLNGNQKNN